MKIKYKMMNINDLYKRIWLLFCFLTITVQFAFSQDRLVINGSILSVGEDALLYVNGNLVVKKNSTSEENINNSGTIIITDSIINEVTNLFTGSSDPDFSFDPAGTVEMKGNKNQTITGIDTVLFNDLVIDNNNNLVPEVNIKSFGDINFKNGNIYLNGHDIELFDIVRNRYSGRLVNENNEYRIIDNINLSDNSNYVRAYSPDIEKALNVGNLGAEVSRQNGDITVERGHTSLTGVTKNSLPVYYNFYSQDNTNDTTCTMVIYYYDSIFNKSSYSEDDRLAIFSDENNNIFRPYESTINKNTNSIEAENLNLLKRYTVSSVDCDPPFILNLPEDTILCQGDTIELSPSFTREGVKLYYSWKEAEDPVLIDTTKTIDIYGVGPDEEKLFVLNALDSRGCSATDTTRVIGRALPGAGFTMYDNYCLADTIHIEDMERAESQPGDTLIFFWNFDDGTFSDSRNPVKNYLSYGAYTIQQKVINQYGCMSHQQRTIDVFDNPVARFNTEQICGTYKIELENQSTVNGSYLSNAIWNINGDIIPLMGETQVMEDTVYGSAGPGTYNISLTVMANGGACTGLASKEVTILQNDAPDFSFNNTCLGDSTLFGSILPTANDSTEYQWDFGDGHISVEANPYHIYNTTGVFTVTLMVFNNNCSTSVSKPVEIKGLESVGIDYLIVCSGQPADFSVNDPDMYDYQWLIEGTSYAGPEISHSFSSSGNFDIELIKHDNITGCIASEIYTVASNVLPVASFTVNDACYGLSNYFSNTSDVSSGEQLNYSWDFDDNTNSIEKDPVHIYIDDYGTKNVTLAVTTENGCTNVTSHNVEIFKNPVIGFAEEMSTCGSQLNLYPHDTALIYEWQDGSTGSNYMVTTDGIYTLSVTDINGCSDHDTVNVYLNTKSIVNLPANIENCGPAILDPGFYPGGTYLWNTGETDQSISIQSTDLYYVILTDQNNCTDTAYSNVVINEYPEVQLTGETEGCSGTPVNITASTNAGSIVWSTGETDVFTIQLTQSGSVRADVTNEHGCISHDEINITFYDPPAVNLPDTVTGCNTVALNAGTDGTGYLWNTNETGNIIEVSTGGMYTVEVTGINNCITGDTTLVVLNYIEKADLGSDINLCYSETHILDAGEFPDDYTILWDTIPGDRYYEVSSPGNYTVNIFAPDGCTTSDNVEVIYHDLPVTNLSEQVAYCSDIITLNAGNNEQTYEWGSQNGFTAQTAVVQVSDTGMYWVRVRNDYCETTDTINVFNTNERIVADFLAPDSIYNDSTVWFTNISYPQDAMFIWDFGDGSNVSTEWQPEHIYYITGETNIRLIGKTSVCSDTMVKSKVIVQRPPRFKNYGKYEIEKTGYISIIDSKLYPNPNNGEFTLSFEISNPSDVVIQIHDLNGRVLHFEKHKVESTFTEQFSVSQLSRGIYIVSVKAKNNLRTHKVIIVK